MAVNEIIIGGDSYTDRQIKYATPYMVRSIDGRELEYDTLTARVKLGGESTAGKYKYRAPVVLKHNGALVGKYYLDRKTWVGDGEYKLSCISAVGLLEGYKHYGGVYEAARMEDVVRSIIGGKIPWSIDPSMADEEIRGLLPIASRRENLHDLLFAMGCTVAYDAAGDIVIKPIVQAPATEIPDNIIYSGDRLTSPEPPSLVDITEHTYFKPAAPTEYTLYTGEILPSRIVTPDGVTADGAIFETPEPSYDYVVSGATVIESGANYICVSGASNCEIKAKEYAHFTREVVRIPDDARPDADEIVIPDRTLVNYQNSANVLERVYNYATETEIEEMSIVRDRQMPGDFVIFMDAKGRPQKGMIKSANMLMSGIVKADLEISTNVQPSQPGNAYKHMLTITEASTFTVPENVYKLRVITIGGGDSGAAGQTGEKGSDSIVPASGHKWTKSGPGGRGGALGPGGAGGKVAVHTIKTTPGTQYAVVIGQGGARTEPGATYADGVTPSNPGQETSFGAYSSATGIRYPTGFVEPITRKIYAKPGAPGAGPGGRGDGWKEDEYIPGETINGLHPGSHPTEICKKVGTFTYCSGPNSGGWGGGPSSISFGSSGRKAEYFFDNDGTYGGGPSFKMGNGGPGHSMYNFQNPAEPGEGNGGPGGAGGGGGGTAGHSYTGYTKTNGVAPGVGGHGGKGQRGEAGNPGIVILYY